MMLRYPEVHTNMQFENIPTMPLELRAGIEKTSFKSTSSETNENEGHDNTISENEAFPEDGTRLGFSSDTVRREKEFLKVA